MTAKLGLLILVSWLALGRVEATPEAGFWARASGAGCRVPLAGQEGTPASPAQQGPSEQVDDDQTTPPIEQRRHLSRRFPAGKVGRSFALDTRYGRVQINAWNKQEIKVETDLVARAETPAAATQILDALGVQYLAYDATT